MKKCASNAVVTPLRKAASYEPRIAILGIWVDTWLTRGKYGIYVAVRGSYGALTGSTRRKIIPIYGRVSYVAVTRIPSLVLQNTWHYIYVIIRYTVTGTHFLNLSYVAHTRRLYAKVWPRHKNEAAIIMQWGKWQFGSNLKINQWQRDEKQVEEDEEQTPNPSAIIWSFTPWSHLHVKVRPVRATSDNTLLKPKRHSLCCHGFMVHAFLLRMHTNVVYFRVMRRLCRREWNWRCVNLHPWQRTRDHGVWRLTLTAYSFREIQWDVAISWQLRGVRGCYRVYVVVAGFTSHSFSRKSPCVTLTGRLYMYVWPLHYTEHTSYSSGYNIHNANCDNANGVIQGFMWSHYAYIIVLHHSWGCIRR